MSTRVASADFIRNIGHWQNEALRQPICITHHGRERLVLAAPDQFRGPTHLERDGDQNGELAALRASVAAMLENMEEGFIGFDASLRIENANVAAEALTGAAREALRGGSVFDAFPDPLASVLADRLQRVARTSKPEAFECGGFDGRHMSVRVFRTPKGLGALFHNTTEQQALRRAREDCQALEHAARSHGGVALVQLDTRGRIEAVDGAFCAWTSFTGEDVVSHRFADLVVAGARREVTTALESVLRDATPLQANITLLGKRGEEIVSRVALAPILADFVPRGARALLVRDEKAQAAA